MEIMENRDLIIDKYGNYYIAESVYGKQVRLVNAVIYYANNRVLNNELLDAVNKQYGEPSSVLRFFTDMVKDKIEGLESGKYPGSIYSFEEVEANYTVSVSGLHSRSVVID